MSKVIAQLCKSTYNKHSDACIYLPPYKLDVLKITYFNKCNTFQVIIDLVHDFMNFNALKII